MKKGTALVRLGKILYVKYGNFLRRIPIERVHPDLDGEVIKEESYIDRDEEVDQDQVFREEEEPVKEMASDLEISMELNALKSKLQQLEDENSKLKENITQQVNPSISETSEVPNTPQNGKNQLEKAEFSRKEKRKAKKNAAIKLSKTHEMILFKEKDCQEWKKGRVVGSYKKMSKYKKLETYQA